MIPWQIVFHSSLLALEYTLSVSALTFLSSALEVVLFMNDLTAFCNLDFASRHSSVNHQQSHGATLSCDFVAGIDCDAADIDSLVNVVRRFSRVVELFGGDTYSFVRDFSFP